MDRMINTLKELLAIDSPTGFFRETDDCIFAELQKMGFNPTRQQKGGVVVELGGSGNDICIAAHADTIGLMVRRINPDGTLVVVPVGGLRPYYSTNANVRVYPRFGKMLTGTVRRANPSTHLMSEAENTAQLDFDTNVVVTLDAVVKTAKDAEALGVRCGDCVAVDPNFVIADNGFIKSRYLDDKASCAILLELARAVSEGRLKLNRRLALMFTQYEEIGHGGAVIPDGIKDFLAVDIGCIGNNHYSDEQKVTIVAKDAAFPYHTEMLTEMVNLAEQNGIAYVLDMMLPRYGSDADVTLRAGYDVRHGLIGPGVLETHGYERTHIDSLKATYDLICAIVSQ